MCPLQTISYSVLLILIVLLTITPNGVRASPLINGPASSQPPADVNMLSAPPAGEFPGIGSWVISPMKMDT